MDRLLENRFEKNNSSKEHILECAKRCFAEKGYSETTIRLIAKEAGISPGTIYLYFKGKKELFQALDIPEAANLHPEFDRKKQSLLQTALLLFGEKGYDGVTMDNIANKQKISKASLYQYCSSKEDLFSQILQNSSFNLYTQSITEAKPDTDIREVIKSIGGSYLQIGDTQERSALFKSVIRDSAQFPELGKLYYEQGIRPACNNIVRYIELHGKKGKQTLQNSTLLFSFVLSYIGSLQSYVLMNNIIKGIPEHVAKKDYLDMTTNAGKTFVCAARIYSYTTSNKISITPPHTIPFSSASDPVISILQICGSERFVRIMWIPRFRTSDSAHPPPILPKQVPSEWINIFAPVSRGAEPFLATMVVNTFAGRPLSLSPFSRIACINFLEYPLFLFWAFFT
jgi:Transcriptional regulator